MAKKVKDDNDYHPSASTSERFSEDQLLRAHGYVIYSRKKGCEPEWTDRKGKVVRHSVALKRLYSKSPQEV